MLFGVFVLGGLVFSHVLFFASTFFSCVGFGFLHSLPFKKDERGNTGKNHNPNTGKYNGKFDN